MCEANVYVVRNGQEELLMEKVDRIIPGEEDTIFMESIFGERKVVTARIREMELVHHRIILEEIAEQKPGHDVEIWLAPDTDHGHFHPGEEVRLKLFKGYNMQPASEVGYQAPRVYVIKDEQVVEVETRVNQGVFEINLGEEADGLIMVYAVESGKPDLYAKLIVEIGHHHHHEIEPAGMPLEIVPRDYSHVHLGDNYEIQVLKEGQPLAEVEVLATYEGSHNREYPFRLVTDEKGRARVFLTARGNWLFSVRDGNIISTFTLIKSF
jgi:uncharacterized GH25 family protein